MLQRALHVLPFLGLTASALALTGCPGDDSSSNTDSATSSGSTTQGPGDTGSSGNPMPTGGGSGDSTAGPETGETGDSTGTTGGPLECPYEEVEGMPPVTLELVGSGFDRPVHAVGHPTEPDRLFVVEQGGDVRILEPGETTAPAEAFLHVDVRGANNTNIGPEYGLLGFAFHPDFPEDPRVYVNYNPPLIAGSMHTVVSEFTVDPGNENQVDPASERVIIELHQPADNHNGGMLAFGSDGYLYIGMGDGGGGGDTFSTGRNTGVLLAKILRIGVEPDGTDDDPQSCMGCPQYGPFDYTIPADNPFVDQAGFAPEIYSWGVRNPWRFARDPATDLVYVGDVGQGAREEISLAASGADLGWSIMEGFTCYDGAPCDTTAGPNEINADGMTMPLIDYSHSGQRCSVTGLSVYRSCQVPGWDGVYFYGDYCTSELFAMVWDGNTVQDLGVVLNHDERIIGNGWNAYGDVFVTTVDAIFGLPIQDGLVYRIAPG